MGMRYPRDIYFFSTGQYCNLMHGIGCICEYLYANSTGEKDLLVGSINHYA